MFSTFGEVGLCGFACASLSKQEHLSSGEGAFCAASALSRDFVPQQNQSLGSVVWHFPVLPAHTCSLFISISHFFCTGVSFTFHSVLRSHMTCRFAHCYSFLTNGSRQSFLCASPKREKRFHLRKSAWLFACPSVRCDICIGWRPLHLGANGKCFSSR